jgi:alcohol dehydrogenase (cytochrome c)
MKLINKNTTRALSASSLALLLAACGGESAAPAASVAFNSQAEEGAASFASNCAACHGASLEGTTLGPILSGNSFLQRWGTQTPALLLNNIQANMPPGGNDGISDEDYINIVAHILSSNGVDAITDALTASTDFEIAGNISQVVERRSRPEPEPPQGITIAGTVENFTPVNDAMLENPDPADWPMHRRN